MNETKCEKLKPRHFLGLVTKLEMGEALRLPKKALDLWIQCGLLPEPKEHSPIKYSSNKYKSSRSYYRVDQIEEFRVLIEEATGKNKESKNFMSKLITFWIDPDLHQRFSDRCFSENVTMSSVLREAVEEFIGNDG